LSFSLMNKSLMASSSAVADALGNSSSARAAGVGTGTAQMFVATPAMTPGAKPLKSATTQPKLVEKATVNASGVTGRDGVPLRVSRKMSSPAKKV
jgi:cell division septation protein DedD